MSHYIPKPKEYASPEAIERELDALDQHIRDDQIPLRISRIIDERDRAFSLASEVISTLLLARNKPWVGSKLRDLAESAWLPQLQALQNHEPLVGDALTIALEASGIDTEKAWERVQAAIERARAREGVPALSPTPQTQVCDFPKENGGDL